MSLAAAETANQFWVEFGVKVEAIKSKIANPPDSATPVFILLLKESITDLQSCKLPISGPPAICISDKHSSIHCYQHVYTYTFNV